jgi:molecular chaperone DnaJ
MAKSYFEILGVPSGASREEIRSAYHRPAKEFHPDHFTGGSAQFKEIQEAYSILGNTPRRRAYERSLEKPPAKRQATCTARPAPEPLVPERKPVDRVDISPLSRSKHPVRPWTKFLNGCGTISPASTCPNPDGSKSLRLRSP